MTPSVAKKLALYLSMMGVLTTAAPGAAEPRYSAWPNGPPAAASFFPIAVWYQNPTAVGAFGAYSSLAAAVAGENMNIFLGLGAMGGGPASWPENFGSDNGELETIKAHNLYVIGGLDTPYQQDTSAQSVASMLALATTIGATSNLIGFNAGDEPDCIARLLEPTIVTALNLFDPTRIVTYNQAHWMTAPAYDSCLTVSVSALQSAAVASSDFYPVVDPWIGGSVGFPKSDFVSVPNDTLFMQGVMVQALVHYAAPGQPVWVFVESGSDMFGGSGNANFFTGGVNAGSTTITNASHWSRFTSTWKGLKVSGNGIPPNTRIIAISDPNHAIMSAAATATDVADKVTVTGGANGSDCVASVNLCVVQGNEYRATPPQVNAEVWSSIINGANGIEYFCHDSSAFAFCLGKGGGAALAVQKNLTYINSTILQFAPVLNASTVGMCSLQAQDYTTSAGWWTTSSCSNGILTLATTNSAVPGVALVKQLNGVTYLFAQSDRRSRYGSIFNFTLAGLGSKGATVVYDSDAQYDPANSTRGATKALNGAGGFSDVLGANGDDYQVKIYAIQ